VTTLVIPDLHTHRELPDKTSDLTPYTYKEGFSHPFHFALERPATAAGLYLSLFSRGTMPEESMMDAARRTGLPFTRIRRAIERLGIEPTRWAGNTRLFRREDLDKAVQQVRNMSR
jgi:hypothetical protein